MSYAISIFSMRTAPDPSVNHDQSHLQKMLNPLSKAEVTRLGKILRKLVSAP